MEEMDIRKESKAVSLLVDVFDTKVDVKVVY